MTDKTELDALFGEPDAGMLAAQLLADLDTPDDELVVVSSLMEQDADDLGIDKAALYEDQDSRVSIPHDDETQIVEATDDRGESLSTEAPLESVKETVKRKRKKAAEAAPTNPNPKPTTGHERQKRELDASGLSDLGYSDEGIEKLLGDIARAPNKVADKATNFLRYALGREHLSNFTRFTLQKLESVGTAGMTVPELVTALQTERSYSPGTARSQAQQMSRLFVLFGMVSKDGSKMTLDSDHSLVGRAKSRLAGTPAPTTSVAEQELAASEPDPEPGPEVYTAISEEITAVKKRVRNRAKKRPIQTEEVAQAA